MERGTLSPAPKTQTELFDEVFPYYLMAGMTYDQFWDGDPSLTIAYRRKLELEDKRFNERAWLQGQYNYIGVATALANGFRKKGAKTQDYPKEPFKVGQETQMETEVKKQKAFDNNIAFLERMRGALDGRRDH